MPRRLWWKVIAQHTEVRENYRGPFKYDQEIAYRFMYWLQEFTSIFYLFGMLAYVSACVVNEVLSVCDSCGGEMPSWRLMRVSSSAASASDDYVY